MSWRNYAAKRLVISLWILLGASLVIFLIVRLTPGDPARAILGKYATEQAVDALRRQMGLQLPLWQQYVKWLQGLVNGQWGRSYLNDKPVLDLLLLRYPRSLEIALVGMIIAVLISFPLGIVGSLNRNSSFDYLSIFFSQVGVSIPSFWLGVLFILLFARFLNVLPATGYVPFHEDPIANLKHVIQPALILGIINAAIFTRFIRSEMLEELSKGYVQTARAYGLKPNRRVWYVLKNAMIPTLTMMGVQLGFMIGGIVVIEKVFSYPGVGLLILDSLLARDYLLLQGSLLVLSATFITSNLIVDLLYGVLDPRIKY